MKDDYAFLWNKENIAFMQSNGQINILEMEGDTKLMDAKTSYSTS
jgi:hypothetical protein